MPSAKITALEKRVLDVFCDAYRFSVPIFQRPYSWTTEQVSVLIDDLLEARKRDRDAPYFLGSIVLIKSEAEPESDVVDGQQRLTTLTLLLCVLRDLATETLKPHLDKRVRENTDPLAGTTTRPRLTLRELDQSFFEENVQQPGATTRLLESSYTHLTDAQRLIVENVRYMHEHVSDLDHDDRKDLATYLLNECYLVVVSASDQDSAFRVFSVMNDRGLDLSPTDILKAQVIGDIHPDTRGVFSRRWENIEQCLGRDRFRHLFAHIRMIRQEDKLRGTIQGEFRDDILPHISSMEEFIGGTVEPYSEIYLELVEPTAIADGASELSKIRELLRHLGRLDNADWIPPAMRFRHGSPNSSELLRFLRDLDRLAYGLFILRANINVRIRRYGRVLRDIREGRDLWRDGGPLHLDEWERQKIVHTLDGDVYSRIRTRLPLLLRLDSVMSGRGAQYEHRIVTIEHVLPQKPQEESEWCRWFPDSEERSEWCHRLANLVLLSRRKNAQASNLEFREKKERYFLQGHGEVTPFALTTGVLSETEWTPEILEQRQMDLIGVLRKEWRLD